MPAKLPDSRIINAPERRGDILVVLPVYNEMPHLPHVVDTIRLCWDGDILAVDDKSSDGSLACLRTFDSLHILHNKRNAGAGGVLLQAFRFAAEHKYKYVITLDADGQHSPFLIRTFIEEIRPHCCGQCTCRTRADFIWGSRYLRGFKRLSPQFQARQQINRLITCRLNELTGYQLTDAFCGFRAYRVETLRSLDLTETGYGMFMQMTIAAAAAGIAIREIPVPLVYLDETRNFNGNFRDTQTRLAYYNEVIDAECRRQERQKQPSR